MNLTLLAAVLPRFAIAGGILDGLRDNMMDCAEKLLSGAMTLLVKMSSFGSILNKSYGVMPELIKTNEGWKVTEEYLLKPFLQTGQSFGAALALIFMVAAMIDIYTQEKMSVETFAKPFLQYLITVAFMTKAELIIAALWNVGILFQEGMAKAGAEASMNINITFGGECSIGLIMGLLVGSIIMMLVCFLLGFAIRICAYIANFSRVIEAALRAVGLPIALGISADSAFRQGALRYIKKFLAVSLQGGIFVVISFLYLSLSVNILTRTGETIANLSDSKVEEEMKAKFDKTTGTIVQEVVKDITSFVVAEAEAAAAMARDLNPIISTAGGIAGVLVQVCGSIIPIIGLALACIVVLFKSGQICNDIVGA